MMTGSLFLPSSLLQPPSEVVVVDHVAGYASHPLCEILQPRRRAWSALSIRVGGFPADAVGLAPLGDLRLTRRLAHLAGRHVAERLAEVLHGLPYSCSFLLFKSLHIIPKREFDSAKESPRNLLSESSGGSSCLLPRRHPRHLRGAAGDDRRRKTVGRRRGDRPARLPFFRLWRIMCEVAKSHRKENT